MIQAYEFAIEKIGLDYASHPVSCLLFYSNHHPSFYYIQFICSDVAKSVPTKKLIML